MDLEKIRSEAINEIGAAKDTAELDAVRIKYLGRKQGLITEALKDLANSTIEEKREKGPAIQALKEEISRAFAEKDVVFESEKNKPIDLTLPGISSEGGRISLLTKTEEEIVNIFRSMNFSVAAGPEIEKEFYNFDTLNIPADHPAREMWDTFWIKTEPGKEKFLLRTHTSPVQVRYMEKHEPPFCIIAPGRTFRYEATDATHETNFYQLEGLMVGKDVSLANFKFVIEEFFRQFFAGKKITVRFRSSYFPFVEPGVEVDVQLDGGRWLEIGGAGMVHPRVLESAGYKKGEWQGFAFGFGIERLAMVKHGIPDMRLFMSGDLRFMKEF